MWVYIVFNAALCFALFYLTKVASFNTTKMAAKFGKKTKTTKSESSSSSAMELEKKGNDSADSEAIEVV